VRQLFEHGRTRKMAEMAAADRLNLIRENLAEVLNPEIIENIIKEGGNPKVYWGE
jgi:tyrosyl-tRNA synthetase